MVHLMYSAQISTMIVTQSTTFFHVFVSLFAEEICCLHNQVFNRKRR
jgi:hypothetical protein